MTPDKKAPDVGITKREPTYSERFAAQVERQFSSEVGSLNFNAYEKTLAQHLFIKIDVSLAEADTKRKEGGLPIAWPNVNMAKLAIDAVNKIQLGIDALIPGSIYPIAYFNSRTKKYDIDLRVGYKGELYYKVNASVKSIRNVRLELVYSTDKFTVYKAGLSQKLEGYDFEITQPFERGELVGGFGYIEYEDDHDNVLVTVSKAEIDKYRESSAGKNANFWTQWYDQMAYKTIVHRLTAKIIIDPQKINATAMALADADEYRAIPAENDHAMLDNAPLELPADVPDEPSNPDADPYDTPETPQ